LVDQRDVGRGVVQSLSRPNPGKTAAEDEHLG
jgi:hypothetical protein